MAHLRWRFGAAALVGSVLAFAACSIGTPVLETSDGSMTTPVDDGGKPNLDANGIQPGPDGSPEASNGGEGGAIDGGSDDGSLADSNVPDVNLPDTFTPPPASAGKPGFDLVTGGTYSKTTKFTLIATLGESPGGNNVASSKSFVLKAGVVAVTQPN